MRQIEKIKPEKLYIAADGPKSFDQSELKKINDTRIVVKKINWKCKVKYKFNIKNKGLRYGIPHAISWFFKHEIKGIILEDDCRPHLSFFKFCEKLLILYANNKKIFTITGTNFIQNSLNKFSYSFSRFPIVWGWATWRRSWKLYDSEIKFWPKYKKSNNWKKFFERKYQRVFFEKVFDQVYNKKIDTWDYQLMAIQFYRKSLTITPKHNLIKNIGFGSDATFNKSLKHKFANLKIRKIGKFIKNNHIVEPKNEMNLNLNYRFSCYRNVILRLIYYVKTNFFRIFYFFE